MKGVREKKGVLGSPNRLALNPRKSQVQNAYKTEKNETYNYQESYIHLSLKFKD